MRDAPGLDGVFAKIGRANHHLAELENTLNVALDPNRYHFEAELENGEHAYRVYGVPNVDPAWRLIVAEGELLLGLSHPNIVRAYEIVTGAETGAPVLILETLTGRTLTHLIDEFSDGLEIEDVAWLGLHLCSAVAYLHRHDHLHLDVKPDNVISESGRAKLIDLSISGPPGSSAVGAGTYDYLAPEQARGERVSAATDVWGIGITLYEALTGTVPFEPDDEDDDGSDSVTGYTDASDDNDAANYPQVDRSRPLGRHEARSPESSGGGDRYLPRTILRGAPVPGFAGAHAAGDLGNRPP